MLAMWAMIGSDGTAGSSVAGESGDRRDLDRRFQFGIPEAARGGPGRVKVFSSSGGSRFSSHGCRGRDVEGIRFGRSNEVLQFPHRQNHREDGIGKVLEGLDEVDVAQGLLVEVGVAQTGGPVVERVDLQQAANERFPFLMVAELVVIGLPQQVESLWKCFIACQAALEQDEGLADLSTASLQRSGQCLQHRVGRVLLDQLLDIGLGHVRDHAV